MDKHPLLDNTQYFTDVTLDSDIGRALNFFAQEWIISKKSKFYPDAPFTQQHFFIVMDKLRVLFWKSNCVYHKICEKEITANTKFTKGTYYTYISKILDKSLRKYYRTPQEYRNHGYRPHLGPQFQFPIKQQSLNACYFFSVRNILKYKYGIGVYVNNTDQYLGRSKTSLTTTAIQDRFDQIAHVQKEYKTDVNSLITALQQGDPVAISYMLTHRGKTYAHVATAYSFDKQWVWVAETVSNRRVHVPYSEFLSWSWKTKFRPFRLFYYQPKYTRTQSEKQRESQHNFLAWER